MKDVSSMTERELKDTVNNYRKEISQHEKSLKGVFEELKLHKTNIDELKEKRNELNAKVRELAKKAREEKTQRDDINKKIADLKSRRNEVAGERNKVVKDINDLKKKRDQYNEQSKGSLETLSKAYAEDLDKFLNADIPLKHELDLFEKLNELEKRLEAAKAANHFHKQVINIYENTRDIGDEERDVSKEIKQLAEKSQQHHLNMIKLYNQVDEIRKEADKFHSQIKETYQVIAPTREKIDPLKTKISNLRDELSIYLDRLNDIQTHKDEQKKSDQHVAAKEKFEKTGKLSLDELRVLMDKGDIKL